MTFTKLRLSWGPATANRITFRFDAIDGAEPYLVKSITGLEPPTQTVSISDKAEEGGGYQGRRPDNRQIVITLELEPDYTLGQTIQGLRRGLYPMLSPVRGYPVTAELLNEAETEMWWTSGYISRIPSNPFSKETTVQIVMDCLSAYWYASSEYVHPDPASLSGKTVFEIFNAGDAPGGFKTRLTLTGSTSFFRFFNEDETAWTHITYSFAIGDVLDINTAYGQRSIFMTRAGVITNMLQFLSPNSIWLQLDGGLNRLKPNVTTYTMQSWSHRARYWGI